LRTEPEQSERREATKRSVSDPCRRPARDYGAGVRVACSFRQETTLTDETATPRDFGRLSHKRRRRGIVRSRVGIRRGFSERAQGERSFRTPGAARTRRTSAQSQTAASSASPHSWNEMASERSASRDPECGFSEHRPESWRSALRRGAKSEQAPNEVAGVVASDTDEGDRLLDGGANAPAGGDFVEVIHRYAGEWSENRARDRGVGAGAGVRTATKDGDRSRKNRGERYEARAERVCEANRGEVASPCSSENGVGRGAGLPTSRPH